MKSVKLPELPPKGSASDCAEKRGKQSIGMKKKKK
jgi:hypothetical protein